MMAQFFASGRAVDLVLGVVAVELVVLRVVFRWGWREAGLMLLPAVFLLLALRAAQAGAGWQMIAVMLGLSFPAHLADLAWRRKQRRAGVRAGP